MPEGDTVWLAAKRMDDTLAGGVLLTTDFRVPQLATADLTGQTVLGVVARGKHLLTRFSGGLTLHTHFRMDGSWHLYAVGARWTGGRDDQVRVVLATRDVVAVGFRLPVVDLLRTEHEEQAVGHLGPDLLGPDWDEVEALRRLRAEPDQEIGLALLDQTKLAGIGNLYRCEALFLRGVHPWTAVSEVADLPALVRTGRRLLLANRDRWQQTTTGSLRRGEDHWVHGRANRPCRRCGTPVQTAEQGERPRERITYWCPRCQPAAGAALGSLPGSVPGSVPGSLPTSAAPSPDRRSGSAPSG